MACTEALLASDLEGAVTSVPSEGRRGPGTVAGFFAGALSSAEAEPEPCHRLHRAQLEAKRPPPLPEKEPPPPLHAHALTPAEARAATRPCAA